MVSSAEWRIQWKEPFWVEGKEFDFSFEIQLLEKYPHGFVSEVGIKARNAYFWT